MGRISITSLSSEKCPLHFTEIFVDFHGFDGRQILLFGLDQVFAFHRFLLLQVLCLAQNSGIDPVSAPNCSIGIRGGERAHGWQRGRFLPALSIALGSPLCRSASSFLLHLQHRLFPFAALGCQALLTADHKHPHPALPEATSCTRVLGTGYFSLAAMPAGHSNQGPVAPSR